MTGSPSSYLNRMPNASDPGNLNKIDKIREDRQDRGNTRGR